MNPLAWIGRRLASAYRTGGDACREGRRSPSPASCLASGCDSVRLSDLDAGERAVVACLEDPGHPRCRKLAGLGLLPGVPVEVLQRRPMYVLRLGYTELALDRELAARVRVRP